MIGEGGIFFMYERFYSCDFNYDCIKENSLLVMQYCLQNSDAFSVIIPPWMDEKIDVLFQLEPWLIKRIDNIKKWPGTEKADIPISSDVLDLPGIKALNLPGTEVLELLQSQNQKYAMHIYSSDCFESAGIPPFDFFNPIENNLPEDICFYRDKFAWYSTVSHEKIAFMENATQDDVVFFENLHYMCIQDKKSTLKKQKTWSYDQTGNGS